MLYFLVPALFGLWLLVAAFAVFAARITTTLRPQFPYVWRMCLWATIGSVVAFGALVGLLIATSSYQKDFVEGTVGYRIIDTVVRGAIHAGPLIVAAIGWLAGLLLGMRLALLRQRRLDAGAAATKADLPVA